MNPDRVPITNDPPPRGIESLGEVAQLGHQIVACVTNGIVVCDRDLRVLLWNPFMHRLTGQPASEVLGKSALDVSPFRPEEGLQGLLERGLAGESDASREVPWKREPADGARWISARVVPLRSQRGDVIGVAGLIREVTDRRQAEESLRLSEARYRRLAENVSDVIVNLDLDLRVTDVSPSSVGLLGYAAEELLGRPLEMSLTPESAAFVRQLAARELSPESLAKKDPSWSMLLELELVCKDGARVWVEAQTSLVFDENQKAVGLFSVTRNITERHRARIEREKSLSLLTATLESTADGILVVDAQGQFERYNQRFLDMWRLPRDIVASGDAAEVAAFVADQLEDPAAFQARVESLKSQPETESYDLLRFKDGRVYERFSRPRRVAGEIVGCVRCFRDVTERERAAAALRLQSAALESADNAIVITDRDGAVVWGNPALTALTGYSAAEIHGKNLRLLRSDRHDRAFYSRIWDTITSGKVWRGEIVNRRKDASLYTEEMTITPLRDRHGEITHFIGIKQDISARKQMETELRESRERFLAIFQSSPTPIAITTLAEGRYVDVNEALLRMMGYAREEVIGRTVAELQVWEQPPQRVRLVELLRERGAAEGFEIRLRDKSGRIHDVLASVKVVHLGAEPCLIFISHDITERKLLEEQLRQAQKMEGIGTLAGGVAHDFNNLLTLIQGHANLVMKHAGLPPECLDSMQQLAKAADQASQLTRQLLAFSRKQPLQRRLVDLNEVVANLTRMLRRIIGEDISLDLGYAVDKLPVLADVGMMEQVLLNLAVNARDAMPAGGLLTITTECLHMPTAPLRPLAQANGTHVARLSVRDTGCGIPAENLPRIFDPFFTTKGAGKGTGLGLATVHSIVQQHQGWIEVESQVNAGTVFHLCLPLQIAAVPPEACAAAPAPVLEGSETILLVEDERAVRLLARQILEHFGYRVIEADSGPSALPLWQQHRDQIDLLLTDMVMPGGLGGRQLAERLRQDKGGLKIVFSSGYSQEALEASLTASQDTRFLQKPYSPQTLARTIRACLDGEHP